MATDPLMTAPNPAVVEKTRTLTIPVNGIYFDQIAAGTKLEEYRLVTDYWRKRLVGRSYDTVAMTRGYPKAGGDEGITRLTRAYRGYQQREITHPHFGPDPVEVFAIDVAHPLVGEVVFGGERR